MFAMDLKRELRRQQAGPPRDTTVAFVRQQDERGPGAVTVFALGRFGPGRSPRACMLEAEEVRKDDHGHILGRFFRLWSGGVFECWMPSGGVWYCTPREGCAFPLSKRDVEARLAGGAGVLPPVV